MLPVLTRKPDPTVMAGLVKRCAPVRKAAPQLGDPLLAEWDEKARLMEDRSEPWLLVPADRDPLRTLKGDVVIPDRARADLHAVLAAGVEFDRVAIAHELDPSGPVARMREHFATGPVTCDGAVAKLVVGAVSPPRKTVATANLLDKVVGGAALAGSVLVNALPAGGGLDPIVFGVLGPDGPPANGQICAWFALAAWRW